MHCVGSAGVSDQRIRWNGKLIDAANSEMLQIRQSIAIILCARSRCECKLRYFLLALELRPDFGRNVRSLDPFETEQIVTAHLNADFVRRRSRNNALDPMPVLVELDFLSDIDFQRNNARFVSAQGFGKRHTLKMTTYFKAKLFSKRNTKIS